MGEGHHVQHAFLTGCKRFHHPITITGQTFMMICCSRAVACGAELKLFVNHACAETDATLQ